MERMLLKPHSIITMDPGRRVLEGGGIIVDGGRIAAVLSAQELAQPRRELPQAVHAYPTLVAIPGFVQTHVHLCQTLFRGLADDLSLLDWLKVKIFPLEAAHTAASMRLSAQLGIAELLRSGTTTIMDMGSIHHEEEIVRAATESGLRAHLGKAMMDVNEIFPALRESTESALASTLRQAEQWHGSAGGRIRYAVAPRFVLSCTDALLREAFALAASFPGMRFHTHAAEQQQEQEAVLARCGMRNVSFLASLGVLHEQSCLAHCVWLDEEEFALIGQQGAKVLHCPSSNLKLGSGIAAIPRMLRAGITVSLGADGAPCNNTLDMFQEMRHAALIQKPAHGPATMTAREVFELATLGGARALGMEAEIGSIETGKRADLVLLDLGRVWNPLMDDDPYSAIVYSGRPENVRAAMVEGVWVCRDGAVEAFDLEEALVNARQELRQLLDRAVVP